MPGFTTHYLFGQQTYQKLSPSKTKQLIQKYNRAFALGLQGPDLFFYDPGCLLHQKPQIGSMIHESKTADFLCALAQAVLLLKPAGLQKPARAYVLGFMGHYLLDAACHPYVYARTGYQHLTGNDSSAYLGRHIALETDIDTTLLDHFLHRCPGEFRQYDAIDLSDQEISLIAQVLFLALQKVFPQVCPSRKNLEHSIRCMIREIKMLYDPTGLKKALLYRLESVYPGHPVISTIVPCDTVLFYPDPCNLRHRPWKNPWGASLSSRDSFLDLFDRATEEYLPVIAQTADLFCSELFSPEADDLTGKLAWLLGNRSYQSGIPLLS